MNLSFNKLFNIAFYLFLAMAALSILTLAATAIVLVLNIGGRLLLAILMVVLGLQTYGSIANARVKYDTEEINKYISSIYFILFFYLFSDVIIALL